MQKSFLHLWLNVRLVSSMCVANPGCHDRDQHGRARLRQRCSVGGACGIRELPGTDILLGGNPTMMARLRLREAAFFLASASLNDCQIARHASFAVGVSSQPCLSSQQRAVVVVATSTSTSTSFRQLGIVLPTGPEAWRSKSKRPKPEAQAKASVFRINPASLGV